jgi:hypothetical protein
MILFWKDLGLSNRPREIIGSQVVAATAVGMGEAVSVGRTHYQDGGSGVIALGRLDSLQAQAGSLPAVAAGTGVRTDYWIGMGLPHRSEGSTRPAGFLDPIERSLAR